jgi:Flp pilus assembly protein TadB
MNVSEKVKTYLNKTLKNCEQKLKKLKRKRKTIKLLYIVSVVLSIITAALVTVISTMTVSMIVITVLSAVSAILTGISVRFNFHDKKAEIKELIKKLNIIKLKLDYVISCNGDLTQVDLDQCVNCI